MAYTISPAPGTIAIAANSTAITGTGTMFTAYGKGALINVPGSGMGQLAAAPTSDTAATLVAPISASAITASPYAVYAQSDPAVYSQRVRELLDVIGDIAAIGLQPGAVGEFADRAGFDGQTKGYVYLSLDGDGADITDPVLYIKNSATAGDWTLSQITGPPGPPGIIGNWRGPWTTATAYAVKDGVQQGGSSYICATAHTSGTFATDLAAGKWQLAAAKGDTGANGTNGVFSAIASEADAIAGTDNAKGMTALRTLQALGLVLTPQGRLSLTSLTPVTEADVTGATTLYYVPSTGQMVPVYDGTAMVPQFIGAQLSLPLDATSTDTGYHQSGKNFDIFAFVSGGVVDIGTGPAWTSDIARGTGAGTTELQTANGSLTNKNAITLRFGSATANTASVAAGQATYLGSFRATANGQASDSKLKRLLFNAYNQAPRTLALVGTFNNYVYSTATWRQVNADATNEVDVLLGLAGTPVRLTAIATAGSSTATSRFVYTGIGVDSATVNSARSQFMSTSSAVLAICFLAFYDGYPGIGFHGLKWLEQGAGTDVQTWYGTNGGVATQSPGLSGMVTM